VEAVRDLDQTQAQVQMNKGKKMGLKRNMTTTNHKKDGKSSKRASNNKSLHKEATVEYLQLTRSKTLIPNSP